MNVETLTVMLFIFPGDSYRAISFCSCGTWEDSGVYALFLYIPELATLVYHM